MQVENDLRSLPPQQKTRPCIYLSLAFFLSSSESVDRVEFVANVVQGNFVNLPKEIDRYICKHDFRDRKSPGPDQVKAVRVSL
jgi:hypothetical protein